MPYVLAFNRPAVDDLLADLGRCLALTSPTFEGVLEWVLGLREQIGIPHTLGVLDVAAGDIEQLARMAARDPAGATNPVALDARAARELYRLALEGELRQA
jgi:alcohol dehydrogenase class IV